MILKAMEGTGQQKLRHPIATHISIEHCTDPFRMLAIIMAKDILLMAIRESSAELKLASHNPENDVSVTKVLKVLNTEPDCQDRKLIHQIRRKYERSASYS